VRRRVSAGWELELIQRHLDELMSLLAVPRGAGEAAFSPPVDLRQSDDNYVVHVDVPGVTASGLVVTLRQRELRIAGRKLPAGEPSRKGHCHHMERGFGTFSVEVLLPGPVRAAAATASLRAGVLEITLPRLKERRDSVFTIGVTDEEP
jgi:HSP20 family protein